MNKEKSGHRRFDASKTPEENAANRPNFDAAYQKQLANEPRFVFLTDSDAGEFTALSLVTSMGVIGMLNSFDDKGEVVKFEPGDLDPGCWAHFVTDKGSIFPIQRVDGMSVLEVNEVGVVTDVELV
jgi:hypothetical protein